jgi:hypothetical protein
MSRHVPHGVGAGHGHTPKGVSCPVPLSRPFVLVVLDIAPSGVASHISWTPSTSRVATRPRAVVSVRDRLKALRRVSAFCRSVPFAGYCRQNSLRTSSMSQARTSGPSRNGRTFCPQSTRAVIRTRRSTCMDGVQRASACTVCSVACQSMTGAVRGSPSSSLPVSTVRAVKGISNPDTPSRCLRTASRVFLTPPLSSLSAKRAITVSAAPSFADEPRVPVSTTLPK